MVTKATKYLFFIIVPIIFLVYFIPIVGNLQNLQNTDSINYLGFDVALINTLLGSLFITLIVVGLSFQLAKILHKSKTLYIKTKTHLLVIPFFIGSIATAYLFKIFLTDLGVIDLVIEQGVIIQIILFALLKFWQYGLAFVFIFYISFENCKRNKVSYVDFLNITTVRETKDLYNAPSINLIIILSILTFVFSFYDHITAHTLLKVSEGSGNEYIGNWLSRNYNSFLISSPNTATIKIVQISIFVFGVLTALLFVLSALQNKLLKLKAKQGFGFALKVSSKIALTIFVLLATIIVAPIFYVLFKNGLEIKVEMINLTKSFLYSFLASVVICFLSFVYASFIRVKFKKQLQSLNFSSLVIIIITLGMIFIPPILLTAIGYKWIAVTGIASALTMTIQWFIGHLIITFPLISSFLIFNNFQLDNNRIDYIEFVKPKKMKKYIDMFVKPFKIELLLALVISISVIWNESYLNRVYSDFVPSFSSHIGKYIEGRSYNYSVSNSYLLISLILSILGITLVGIGQKRWKRDE